ncbi:MAG: oligosaccharide flippase family protein [Crocinitomicaceae bacterium]|nr:oligosaccharide flippase family protein [Crocinitomicaceae bacterium]
MKSSQNITRSTFLTILAQLPAHLLGIIAGIFITRILGPEDKGLYTIYFTNINLFISLFGFTVTNSIIYFIGSKKLSEDSLRTIILIIITSTVALTGATLFFWLNSSFIDLFLPNSEVTISLILLFISIILIIQINASFTAYFQGLRHFKVVNQILILNSAYNLILFSGAYFLNYYNYYSIGLLEVVFISFLVLILNTIHWVVYYLRQPTASLKFKLKIKDDFIEFIQYTGLNHFVNMLFFLNQRLILWIIALYLDNWHIGIFSLGTGLAQLIYYFSNPIALILESFLSADIHGDRIKIFSIFSRIQFSIVLIVCFIAVLISPKVLPLIYGNDFSDSVTILNIVVFGILMSCQSMIVTSLFLALNKLKYNVISSILGVVVTLISAPILIKQYGINGAAYSQLITYISIFIVQFLFVKIKIKTAINLFIVTKSDIAFVKKQLNKNKHQVD